jgi:hypothetical protein
MKAWKRAISQNTGQLSLGVGIYCGGKKMQLAARKRVKTFCFISVLFSGSVWMPQPRFNSYTPNHDTLLPGQNPYRRFPQQTTNALSILGGFTVSNSTI